MNDRAFFVQAFSFCIEELSKARKRGERASERRLALLEENLQAAKRKMGAEQAAACLDEAAADVRRFGSWLDETLVEEARRRL